MAFDFLGTFKRSEYTDMVRYAEALLPMVVPRIKTLKGTIERLGWVEYEFNEEGERINYTVQPVDSQLAKYVLAYEYRGGSLNDLQIRSRGDWIYITKGTFDLSESTPFAGGRPSEGKFSASGIHYEDDTVPATHVARVKDWMVPSIKVLEDLEFRIKRVVDLTDQCIEEIVLLVKRSTGAETLEALKSDIEFFIASKDFPTATED